MKGISNPVRKIAMSGGVLLLLSFVLFRQVSNSPQFHIMRAVDIVSLYVAGFCAGIFFAMLVIRLRSSL